MLKIAKRPRTRSIRKSPNLTICPSSSSSSSIGIAPHSCTRPPWFSHKIDSAHSSNVPFGQQSLCTFQLKTPRYKSTSSQHFLRKDAIALSRGLLSRGAVCANAHAYVMYAGISTFGAPWHSRLASTQTTKKYKIIS